MVKRIYRDLSGVVINVGEWQYIHAIAEDRTVYVTNPIPSGSIISDEDVEVLPDGSVIIPS
jgi:hypothetical protein